MSLSPLSALCSLCLNTPALSTLHTLSPPLHSTPCLSLHSAPSNPHSQRHYKYPVGARYLSLSLLPRTVERP